MERIISLIKKICEEHNTKSPTEVGRIARTIYNESISTKILTKYCGQNVKQDSEFEDNPEIIEITSRIETLRDDFKKASSVADRCRLSGQLDSAQESKAKIKKLLREAEQIRRSSDKAQYIVKFGEPQVIEMKKPFFKTDEKQKALPVKEGE